MNAETLWTYFFGLFDMAFIVFLVNVAYQSAQRSNVWHFNLYLTFGLLFAMEYELYREASRLAGWPVSVTDMRVRYVCALYLAIGLFVREVLYHVEQYENRVSTLQDRADL